jgi:hypothetical protein
MPLLKNDFKLDYPRIEGKTQFGGFCETVLSQSEISLF